MRNEHGRVAAELEGDTLDALSRPRKNLEPRLVTAREADLADERVGGERFTRRRAAGDNVQHPGRKAALLGSRSRQGERAERRLRGRFGDDRASRR